MPPVRVSREKREGEGEMRERTDPGLIKEKTGGSVPSLTRNQGLKKAKKNPKQQAHFRKCECCGKDGEEGFEMEVPGGGRPVPGAGLD